MTDGRKISFNKIWLKIGIIWFATSRANGRERITLLAKATSIIATECITNTAKGQREWRTYVSVVRRRADRPGWSHGKRHQSVVNHNNTVISLFSSLLRSRVLIIVIDRQICDITNNTGYYAAVLIIRIRGSIRLAVCLSVCPTIGGLYYYQGGP